METQLHQPILDSQVVNYVSRRVCQGWPETCKVPGSKKSTVGGENKAIS
jgi:hypothetical protein